MDQERNLAEMIRRLEADRRRHSAAIAAIDEVLSQVSKVVGTACHNEVETASDVSVATIASMIDLPRRRKFEQTGERSVLDFIKARGNPTTSEINAHWKSSGRRGVANVILLRLLKQGAIRRELHSDVRGSRYVLADDEGVDRVNRIASFEANS